MDFNSKSSEKKEIKFCVKKDKSPNSVRGF